MTDLFIYEVERQGYAPLHRFRSWKVAGICYAERFDCRNLSRVERHLETDELFVLLKGRAALIVGGSAEHPANLRAVAMRREQVYAVPQGTWHHILCGAQAKVLIAEEAETGPGNSAYHPLSDGEIQRLRREWEKDACEPFAADRQEERKEEDV